MKVIAWIAFTLLIAKVNSTYVCNIGVEKESTGCIFKNLQVEIEREECENDFDFRLSGSKIHLRPQSIHWADIVNSTFVKPTPFFQPFHKLRKVNILGCKGLKNVGVPLFGPNTVLISVFMTNLETVGENIFKGLPNLKALILTRDEIKEVHSKAFKDLRQLKSIDLGLNEIKTLSDDVFAYNINLENVHLDNNKIISLNARLFSNNRNLRSLDVHSNKIWLIDQDFVNNLRTLASLNLKSNRCADISVDLTEQEDLNSLLGECYRNHCNWHKKSSSGSSQSTEPKSGSSSESSESDESLEKKSRKSRNGGIICGVAK